MGKKKKLTAEDILSSVDVKPEVVEVPQWGGTVTIQAFTKEAQQRARKQAMSDGEMDTDRLELILFIEGVIEPKFTEADYEKLKGKSAAAIDLVLEKIMSASSIDPEEAKQVGA